MNNGVLFFSSDSFTMYLGAGLMCETNKKMRKKGRIQKGDNGKWCQPV